MERERWDVVHAASDVDSCTGNDGEERCVPDECRGIEHTVLLRTVHGTRMIE